MNIFAKRIYPGDDRPLPAYSHPGDAGLDLRAYIPPDDLTGAHGTRYVNANTVTVIGTGIALDIPPGFVGIVKGRSGQAMKHGWDVIGGVVDSGYHGEISVFLTATTYAPHINPAILHGDRIAQILIMPVAKVALQEVEGFEEDTPRGKAGMGSTGVM